MVSPARKTGTWLTTGGPFSFPLNPAAENPVLEQASKIARLPTLGEARVLAGAIVAGIGRGYLLARPAHQERYAVAIATSNDGAAVVRGLVHGPPA